MFYCIVVWHLRILSSTSFGFDVLKRINLQTAFISFVIKTILFNLCNLDQAMCPADSFTKLDNHWKELVNQLWYLNKFLVLYALRASSKYWPKKTLYSVTFLKKKNNVREFENELFCIYSNCNNQMNIIQNI